MLLDLQSAKQRLEEQGLSCVLCRNTCFFESSARGVAPLLQVLDSGECPTGFCAADRVVGAGAAYLYVLLGAAAVYAAVISKAALSVLSHYNIAVSYGCCVPHIINRTGDGICPIEQAVAAAADPQDALLRIRERLSELTK